MKYSELCGIYEKLDSTSKRLEKTFTLSNFLKNVPDSDVDDLLLLFEGRIFPEYDEKKIGIADSIVAKAIKLSSGRSMADIESVWRKKGDLGLVAFDLIGNKSQATLFSQTLYVSKVVSNLRKIAGLEGVGTVDLKIKLLSELLTSATPVEAKYIVRTALETLRLGISSSTIRDAISWSVFVDFPGILTACEKCGAINPNTSNCLSCGFELKAEKELKETREKYNELIEQIDQAYKIINNFGEIIRILRTQGREGLLKIKPVIGSPMKAMLYQKVKTVDDAFTQVGRPCAIEYKYDGFRILLHKNGNDVKLFTRNLEDVTLQFPDIVETAKNNILIEKAIVDGEVVGYDKKTKKYLPFQKISQRIKRKYDVDDFKEMIAVEWTVFDIIFNGESLLDMPLKDRRNILENSIKVEDGKLVLSKLLITDDSGMAAEFYAQALSDGQEGVMFKNLDAPYRPGARVGFGVKLKPVMDPLDLVIVGAEWGEGKRATWFTSFTVACRDDGELVEIGKVGTGFKEVSEDGLSFSELTKLLEPLIVNRNGREVVVKAKIVLELAFEEIQRSNTYSSGYALRFPRVLRLRPEKPIDEISTLEDVQGYFDAQK
ncbi:ATP-dependent DNA ligase [Candidatus Woesearchaeota archaeon]|nr:ATP-dependent DNA ligase [Candidatus Woesearchaeota archaeon]